MGSSSLVLALKLRLHVINFHLFLSSTPLGDACLSPCSLFLIRMHCFLYLKSEEVLVLRVTALSDFPVISAAFGLDGALGCILLVCNSVRNTVVVKRLIRMEATDKSCVLSIIQLEKLCGF